MNSIIPFTMKRVSDDVERGRVFVRNFVSSGIRIGIFDGRWFPIYDQASTNYELLETRKKQNELLLQEDVLMFLLQCEHLFTPSNFTLVARLSATSEGMLYRSYGGFSRTDVPSSQYKLGNSINVRIEPPRRQGNKQGPLRVKIDV